MLIGLLVSSICMSQVVIPDQKINYKVRYHWGFINLDIAHGTVTLKTDGDEFLGTLNGRSIPWRGRVYSVSDTLRAEMSPAADLIRETVKYINGWYRKPLADMYHSDSYNPNDPANYKNIKGEGCLSASPETIEAVTVTADMLGLFYYFRQLDFEAMEDGHIVAIPITGENGKPGKVVVTYNGRSEYTIGNTVYPVYDVVFEYSYKGRMSGYSVNSKVDTSSRVPLVISASLPAGDVEMIYQGIEE